jgi:protocadherin Fat 1/2/3
MDQNLTINIIKHISSFQVNLHDPVMKVQHLPEVIENSNTDIYAIIRIDDPDPGRHGEVESVEIIEGDPEAHFRVRPSSANDPKEFNIEVLQLLDREISPLGYNLTLKAVDRGVPPR